MGALTLRIGSRRTLAASLLGLAMATLAFARAWLTDHAPGGLRLVFYAVSITTWLT